MDPAKVELLFDEVPDWADLDDPADRAVLVLHHRGAALGRGSADGAVGVALRTVAEQIATEDPPETWAAAQRCLAAGQGPVQVMRLLTIALTDLVLATIDTGGDAIDDDEWRARLASLPLPSLDELATRVCDDVAAHQGAGTQDVLSRVGESLGAGTPEALRVRLLDEVVDVLMLDGSGEVEMLSPDRLVHLPSLWGDGTVHTVRIDDVARRTGVLDAAADLPGFGHRSDLTVDGEPVQRRAPRWAEVLWAGPEGWLEAFDVGDVVAVRVDGDGGVHLERLDEVPAVDDETVAAAVAAYERGDRDGSERVLTVALEMRLAEPSAFTAPGPPLSEVLRAAGLDVRGGRVADDPRQWRDDELTARTFTAVHHADDDRTSRTVARLLDLLDESGAAPSVLRSLLVDLDAPEVRALAIDVALAPGGEVDPAARGLADRLVGAARRPYEQAIARWYASVLAELDGDLDAAEAHLVAGRRADPGDDAVVDRLAWYRADRGDAAGAVELWRSLGAGPEDSVEIAMATLAAERVATAKGLGRNDPCWCGSGRKHKQCHLDRPALAPLQARVGWLVHKALAYLNRSGNPDRALLVELAEHLVDDPDDVDQLVEGADDPVVVDLVLFDHGVFAAFLEARGPLLPDDERALGELWLGTTRSVHEVAEVRPREGFVLVDRRDGTRLEVRERVASELAETGDLLCARVLPDGEAHQLAPGLFAVPADDEELVVSLVEAGHDGALLGYLRARRMGSPELD